VSATAGLWIHLQSALLALCLAARLSGPRPWPRAWRQATAPLALGLGLLPLGGLDLSAQALPYTGFLSLTSLLLLTDCAGRRLAGMGLLPTLDRRLLLGSAAALGLALYPATLGLGRWDPYGLGLSGAALPLALGGAAALAWWRGHQVAALLLLAVLWAWLLGLGESQSLWDYLIDPWLILYAIPWAMAPAVGRRHPPL